jgi:outer membrane protein assembly factor BamB
MVMAVLSCVFASRQFLADRKHNSAPVNWNINTGRNVRWVAKLGTSNYGGTVVAEGRVFVSTNNGAGHVPRFPSYIDLGCLLAFDERTGEFIWQHSNEKLPDTQDLPLQGVVSMPLVEGDRLWYVSNRCEVVCLDTAGFSDHQNNGLIQNELYQGPNDADLIWTFDMRARLGVSPHEKSTCNVVADKDRLFVCTSNGVGSSDIVATPQAPSFIALDKQTGTLLWSDSSPGGNSLHGQWGSPVVCNVDGRRQVIFPGGDGWLYSFDVAGAPNGRGRLLWRFDCNPKTSQFVQGIVQKDRLPLVGAPTVHRGLVYVAMGDDVMHDVGQGRLWCIDPTHCGDVSPELVYNRNNPEAPVAPRRAIACDVSKGDFTRPNPNSALAWKFDGFDLNSDGQIDATEELHLSLGSAVAKDGLVVMTDIAGWVWCLDAASGTLCWRYDQLATGYATPMIAGDYVYTADEDGDISIFRLSADPQIALPGGLPIFTHNMGNNIYTSPVTSGDVLYISTRKQLFALQHGAVLLPSTNHSLPAPPRMPKSP